VTKANCKTIKILKEDTNEVLTFESQQSAAEYLNISKGQMSKFKNGTKTINGYKSIN
jgi:hypothetical protein